MIERAFAYHTPSEDGRAKLAVLRQSFSDMQRIMHNLAPESRERALAQTSLESAAMWAVKAVVLHDPASVADLNSLPEGQ